ncbi:MAG: putative quinol monooxygenase, partial [bacterium]
MIIITGFIDFPPEDRHDVLEACSELQLATREQRGCLDYVWSADPAVPGRVYVFERWEDEAAETGKVTLCIPEGAYNFRPQVMAVNPNGSSNLSQMKRFDLNVGCQQKIVVTPGLQIALNDTPLVSTKKY